MIGKLFILYILIFFLQHFPTLETEKALARPILYSNWLSKDYLPVDQEELREYVKARLKVIQFLVIYFINYICVMLF